MESITGIVRNAHNVPVEDVNMVIVAGPSHPDIVAVTAADGTFSFDNLRPGNYLLKAYGRAVSDEIPVQVFRNQLPFVEIWLAAEAPAPENNVIDEENYFHDDTYLREE